MQSTQLPTSLDMDFMRCLAESAESFTTGNVRSYLKAEFLRRLQGKQQKEEAQFEENIVHLLLQLKYQQLVHT